MMKTIEMRKERWRDLYQDTGETKILYQINCREWGSVPSPLLWPEYKQERIEWAWKSYQKDLEKIKWLPDDSIPNLYVASGTEIYAESFGAKVHRPVDNMPFAIPFVFSPQEAEMVKIPHLEDTPLMDLFDIADELKKRGGPEAILKLPDVQSPMDIVAQIWDKSDLFPSMIEEPEVVKELAEKAKTLLVEFWDNWFARYGTEYISHCPDFYMQGGITMSVDEIGNVSSDMYQEFFEEEINEISGRYGGIGIHYCADAEHQWEYLRKIPGLRMLNLYRPERILDDSYAYFKDVTAMWPAKMEHNVPEPLRNKRKEEYPAGSRLVIVESANTIEDAVRLAETLEKNLDKSRIAHMIPQKRK